MRISDWSSDVCSSDLLSYGSRDLLTSKSSINLPLGDTFAVKLAGLLSRQDGFVENTGPGGDFGGHKEWAARIDARWLAADRSEEHTSELQSLMRISYAVFCLKKKIKYTNTTTTHTNNNHNEKQHTTQRITRTNH